MLDGVRAQVPVRRPEPDRRFAQLPGEQVARAQSQVPFRTGVEERVVLVHPAVNAHFVPGAGDALRFVGVDLRTDGGHEECRLHVVAAQCLENARHADPAAEFPPGKATDRRAPGPEFVSFVVAVEGECDGAPGAAGPHIGFQGTAGADAADKPAPVAFRLRGCSDRHPQTVQ